MRHSESSRVTTSPSRAPSVLSPHTFIMTPLSIPLLVASLHLVSCRAQQLLLTAHNLAARLSLTTNSSPPFPTTMLNANDTETFLVSNWGLAKGEVENGAPDLAFVEDPFPNGPVPSDPSLQTSFQTGGLNETATNGPVLQVFYSNGSYSNVNNGGAQFYSLWNPPIDSGGWKTMMVSYEVAFDPDFDWVMGGKLPGLRGGALHGCSGGDQADGDNCFSARVMWRKHGMGEGMLISVTSFYVTEWNIFV